MTEGVVGDPEFGSYVINDTDLDTRSVLEAAGAQNPEIAAMTRWVMNTKRRVRKSGSLFDRDRYVTPDNFFDQIDVARDAAEHDDVVSAIIDSTESLAFSRMSIECDDADEEDVWNQVAAELDLDGRLREMWRELAIASQVYVFVWYGNRNFKVRGKSEVGRRRKKEFTNLRVPIGMTILDPKKIVPVSSGFFNKDKLVYIVDSEIEKKAIDDVLAGRVDDKIISSMILGPFEASEAERNKIFNEFNLPSSTQLYVTNPQNVWRHTLTRSQYQAVSPVRMVSVFELLDMKTQLREMDRAHLAGATSFIVLIKKGTDNLPAKPAEVQHLQASVRTMARVPVIVGDHRLAIEIVTPKVDQTLKSERHDMLDSRISVRMYQMFVTPGVGPRSAGDDSIKLGRVVARGLESRRHMLRRAIERNMLKVMYDQNDQLKEEPSLAFHPKQIALDFDTGLATFYMDLRDRNEISRDTLLSQVDIDEDVEARKKVREKESGYDEIFQTAVPFNGGPGGPGGGASPDGGSPADVKSNSVVTKAGGRAGGGNRNGGGAAPGTGQGKPAREPAKKADNGSTRKTQK